MKGWVGLVGWPIADGLPTIVVTHQLQVERRTGKVRRPETDVLPLCHATNLSMSTKLELYADNSTLLLSSFQLYRHTTVIPVVTYSSGPHPSARGIRIVSTQRTVEVYETSHYPTNNNIQLSGRANGENAGPDNAGPAFERPDCRPTVEILK